ncbi:MAG: hypothetical protein ACLP9L_08745 [Thermoguttaceae bacterium]
MEVLDVDANPSLLRRLKNDIVMVGLNVARPFSEPFRNFHDADGKANDFRLRHAFTDTPHYGAYMTDVIKNHAEVDASKLAGFLSANPMVVKENVGYFLEELADLQCLKPLVLAFGVAAYRLVAEHIPRHTYSRLIRLTHFSCRIEKENYRQKVLREISDKTP